MVIGNHLSCASGYEIMGQEELKLGGNTFAFLLEIQEAVQLENMIQRMQQDYASLCKHIILAN